MNHARLIYEDTPAFIPVPRELQHRKIEITFLPLDDEGSAKTPDDLLTNFEGEPITPSKQNFPDLSEFHKTLPKQEMSAGEFCRKMRDEDRY